MFLFFRSNFSRDVHTLQNLTSSPCFAKNYRFSVSVIGCVISYKEWPQYEISRHAEPKFTVHDMVQKLQCTKLHGSISDKNRTENHESNTKITTQNVEPSRLALHQYRLECLRKRQKSIFLSQSVFVHFRFFYFSRQKSDRQELIDLLKHCIFKFSYFSYIQYIYGIIRGETMFYVLPVNLLMNNE